MSTQTNAARGARQLVEDYRRLQQQLALAVGGTGAHVVAFTSPAAGCGRATLCSNLAILTAQSGKRVLVADADLYAPAQHRNFRAAPGQGLADAAAGLCRAEDCLVRDVAPGVDLLPAALLALAEKFGVMPSETMSFCDSGNDISMIEAAGVGVVMDNARDEIKAHADLIAPSNQDEGVAQIIEKYVLEGDKA